MNEIEKSMRKLVRELLTNGEIDLFIGYEEGSVKNSVRPTTVRSRDETEKLIWNKFCKNNLALYLLGMEERIGIVTKGCDSRAIIELIKEGQVNRENLYIIGVPCRGMLSRDGELYDSCKKCKYKNPVTFDFMLGERVKENDEEDFSDLEEIENLPIKERLEFWKRQFDKCINCNACRNICPLCYCKECVFDKKNPEWISKPRNSGDKWFFHITRAVHLAGRCVDCGECERACPVGIPIRKLYRKVNRDVKELFDYEPGVSPDDKNPLIVFDTERDEEIL